MECLKMRYIRFFGDSYFSGTDFEEVQVYEDSVSDFDINNDADDYMESNAQNYEYLVGDDFETEQDREEVINDYYSSCWCDWEEITEQEYKKFIGEKE